MSDCPTQADIAWALLTSPDTSRDDATEMVLRIIRTLEAIVAKLPKMADGVYWIPGADVEFYHPHEAGSHDDVSLEDDRWVAEWWVLDRVTGGGCRRWHDIGDCYSTQEAAEAARKEALCQKRLD